MTVKLSGLAVGSLVGIHTGVNPRIEAIDGCEHEHLKGLPAIHLCATRAGAFQSSADVSPPSALASPLTFTQTDDRLNLATVKVVGVEHPQELGGSQQLIDVVVVVGAVGAGVRVGYQVAKVFVEPLVDVLQRVRLALVACLQ